MSFDNIDSSNKEVVVLVMSVGEFKKNATCKYFIKIGGKDSLVVCLPKQFEENAKSYEREGIRTYIYDESKYINDKFEFFGFKPRNCGGVGRQGIAEATEKYGGPNTICFEVDDDTSNFVIKKDDGKGGYIATSIKNWETLKKFIQTEDEFYELTGIECMGTTGASIPKKGEFICNRKIYNNFIMRKGNRLNFDGFKALCSDDNRYNLYRNLLDATPMITTNYHSISFAQNQGDRDDGNATLYNGDYSWKKSYSLKMMMPWGVTQSMSDETNRILFRENIQPSKLYPPICLTDEKGEIVNKV